MPRWIIAGATCLLLAAPLLLADDKPKTSDNKSDVADKDPFDTIVKEMLKVLKDGTAQMTKAVDPKSAEGAKTELKALNEKMQAINERLAKLGSPNKEQEAALDKKYKPELDETVKAYQTQVQRLMKEPYGKDLIAVLEKKPDPKKPKDK